MEKKHPIFKLIRHFLLLPLTIMALGSVSIFGATNTPAPAVSMPTPTTYTPTPNEPPAGSQISTSGSSTPSLTPDVLPSTADMPPALSNVSSSIISKIIQRGKLIVAIHAEDHSPFHMRNEKGELIGIDIEIAQQIGRYLNVSVEFNREAKTFDELIDIVAKHKADLSISKLSYTPQRANKVRFTLPYIKLHQAFIISRLTLAKMGESPTLTEIFSDSQHQLGVMEGTSYVLFAREMLPKNLNLQLSKNWNDIINSLVAKEFVGAFRDDNEIRKVLIKRPEMNLSFVSIILKNEEDPICIAVSRDEEEFAYWLNSLIRHEPKVRFELSDVLKKYKEYL